jgi:hypothetical protein
MQPQGMRALALPDSSSSSTATYLTAVLIISSLPVLHGVPFLLVLATDRCAARELAGSPA